MAIQIPIFFLTYLIFTGTNAQFVYTYQDLIISMKFWATIIEDPNDALHNWRDPNINDPCYFEGVTCNPSATDFEIIHEINLNNFGLSGDLTWFMWCAGLYLDYSNNKYYF